MKELDRRERIEISVSGSKPIGYQNCVDALLMMWMDDILTDGEYKRIMDKLNKHYGK